MDGLQALLISNSTWDAPEAHEGPLANRLSLMVGRDNIVPVCAAGLGQEFECGVLSGYIKINSDFLSASGFSWKG